MATPMISAGIASGAITKLMQASGILELAIAVLRERANQLTEDDGEPCVFVALEAADQMVRDSIEALEHLELPGRSEAAQGIDRSRRLAAEVAHV
jgi:hypothetical protein